MIPKADIVAWRQVAPWVSDAQVEQDLIICRALVAIFKEPFLVEKVAFRGGTAIHKLYLKPAQRYSEDIDLVQLTAGPIGEVFDGLQEVLNSFLGIPRRKQTEDAVSLSYRMESEGPPVLPLRLKIEINTREHLAFLGLQKQSFIVNSRWYNGKCTITTFTLEELLATKVRALYQRRKGRDLFDLWLGFRKGKADAEEIIRAFKHYMKARGYTISKIDYEKNLRDKIDHPGFRNDLNPLLLPAIRYNVYEAADLILNKIISRL